MKKKLFQYIIFGFVMGIFISITMSVLTSFIISQIIGTPVFSYTSPAFVEKIGNEWVAAFTQYCLSGLLGIGFSLSALIWQVRKWSLLKQVIINFIVTASIMFIVAWFSYWMPHTVKGVIIYYSIFIAIYIIIYIINYFYWKNKLKKLNESIQKR